MTEREFYRNILIELNKEEASALYVEDFLYFGNKSINEYVNARYSFYDTSQQLGDDLRVLRMPGNLMSGEEGNLDKLGKPDNSTDINVPTPEHTRYRHLLNCSIDVLLKTRVIHCEQEENTVESYPCKRLTADRKTAIMDNSFLKPMFYRPYYDIVGNTLTVKLGDESKIEIKNVSVEYLRNPKTLKLASTDLLKEEDTTELLEFPDYVNYEIIKIAVKLILEQGGDPRLGSNPQVNQSIGPFPQSK